MTNSNRRGGWAVFAAVAIVAVAAAGGLAAAGQTGADQAPPAFTVTLTPKPEPPVMGDNEFTVVVKDPAGAPVVGAEVAVELVMPAMARMPEMRSKATLKPAADPKAAAAGTYTGRGQITMAGRWHATVTVTVSGKIVAEHRVTLTAK